MIRRTLYGLLALAFLATGVTAALYNFPVTTPPLTGAETFPADTNLSGGRAPQTEIINVDQIKEYVFGNTGTVSATVNTTSTAVSNAVTSNTSRFVITSEALTTAAAATYTVTMTNSRVLATSIVLASVQYGTSSTGTPVVAMVTPGAGSVVIIVQNIHATAALNGTIKISGVVIN